MEKKPGTRGPKPRPVLPGLKMPSADAPPSCPKWLRPEAKREFKRLAPMLHDSGVLTQGDVSTFVAYCQAWGEFLKVSDTIEAMHPLELLTVTDAGRELPSPLIRIRDNAFRRLVRAASLLGLTPVDRKRVQAEAAEEADAGTEFLRRPAMVR